jgi:hypothetical protein
LRGVAGYSHAWVGGDRFLSSPHFGIELHRSAGERGATRGFVEIALDDYRFESADPAGSPERRARDRDGVGLRAGAEHRRLVSALESTLSGAIAYRRFSADGSEYSFDSPELELALESALPAKLVLLAGARYAYRHYRHPTTFTVPSRERREHEVRTDVSLRRPLWRQLSLELRWRYQRNRSTAAVFDYARHVAGMYASWTPSP